MYAKNGNKQNIKALRCVLNIYLNPFPLVRLLNLITLVYYRIIQRINQLIALKRSRPSFFFYNSFSIRHSKCVDNLKKYHRWFIKNLRGMYKMDYYLNTSCKHIIYIVEYFLFSGIFNMLKTFIFILNSL